MNARQRRKQVSIGSWSSGSLKNEDVIPAAIDCLASLDAEIGARYQKEWDAHTEGDPEIDADELDGMYDEIVDAINERLPAYLYWGAHEGDGADFGVWVSWDTIEEDRRSGELPSGDELPDVPSGQFLHVSDHGNMELYEAQDGKWVSVWSCV